MPFFFLTGDVEYTALPEYNPSLQCLCTHALDPLCAKSNQYLKYDRQHKVVAESSAISTYKNKNTSAQL